MGATVGGSPAKRAKTDHSFLFSSESVNEGHPDKLCDQVSDAVLDACLKVDPNSKVACETACKDNMVMVLGEITTGTKLDYDAIVRGAVKGIGYDSFVDDLGSADERAHRERGDREVLGRDHAEKWQACRYPVRSAHELAHQPVGEVHHWRPSGRCWPHWAENNY